jgi:hypothetical protein
VREGGGGDAPRPEQVDVDDRQRPVVGPLARALREADARVVDEHVEPAEPLDGLGDRAVDSLLVAHVARDDALAGPQVEADHERPALAQLLRRGGADAARRAGDDDPRRRHSGFVVIAQIVTT